MTPEHEWRAAVHAHERRRWADIARIPLAYALAAPLLLALPAIITWLEPSQRHHCQRLRMVCWTPREHVEFALLVAWLLLPPLLVGLTRVFRYAAQAGRRWSRIHRGEAPIGF